MSIPLDQAIARRSTASCLPRAETGEARVSRGDAIASFNEIYRSYFGDVARWVRALGANRADIEDLTQDVFIIVERKLGSFDGRNLPGFLYRIAQRTVRDHRRSAWIRRLFGTRAPLPDVPAASHSALDILHEHERQRMVEGILARMSEKRRSTFWLFEIEGYTGEEIARIQSLPLKTVWTRLHHARKDFLRMVSELSTEERDQT